MARGMGGDESKKQTHKPKKPKNQKTKTNKPKNSYMKPTVA